MFFRQINAKHSYFRFFFVVWLPKQPGFPDNETTIYSQDGKWDYNRHDNKSNFKLELIT